MIHSVYGMEVLRLIIFSRKDEGMEYWSTRGLGSPWISCGLSFFFFLKVLKVINKLLLDLLVLVDQGAASGSIFLWFQNARSHIARITRYAPNQSKRVEKGETHSCMRWDSGLFLGLFLWVRSIAEIGTMVDQGAALGSIVS